MCMSEALGVMRRALRSKGRRARERKEEIEDSTRLVLQYVPPPPFPASRRAICIRTSEMIRLRLD